MHTPPSGQAPDQATIVELSTEGGITSSAARKPRRIGFLGAGTTQPWQGELVNGLRALGYEEGQDVIITRRFAGGGAGNELASKLAELGQELLDDPTNEVIVTADVASALALQKLTQDRPIVMAVSGDPVGLALVDSLAHPGHNITGLTTLSDGLTAKRLQLLHQMILQRLETPSAVSSNCPEGTQLRIAIMWNPSGGERPTEWQETYAEAAKSCVEISRLDVQDATDIESAFAGLDGIDGVIAWGDPILAVHRDRIAELALGHRVPAMFERPEFVDAGGLMGYSVSLAGLYRRSAAFVDRILHGLKPSDLPVEHPTEFEFVLNESTAEHLGLSIDVFRDQDPRVAH